MVITTSNVGVFDKSLYQALSQKVSGYFMEDAQLNWIPQALVTPLHANTYKKPIYGASINVRGATRLSLPNETMKTPQSHNVYPLEYQNGDIYYDINDMLMEGEYLVQRKSQELATWQDQVKQAIFKGVFTKGFVSSGSTEGAGQGIRLNDGIIEQATLVEDLNGTDSLLDAAGDIYKAMTKIVNSIPFRFRDGKQVLIGCDDKFVATARKALFRGATNQESEFDLFLKELSSGKYNQNGQSVMPKLIVSDKLFLNKVPGTTKTETDTLGTHSRLFAAVIDPQIIEQAYSYIGHVGDERHDSIGAVDQKWAARCSGCVHQAEAVVYSEQITY